jgi:uncharacterized protein
MGWQAIAKTTTLLLSIVLTACKQPTTSVHDPYALPGAQPLPTTLQQQLGVAIVSNAGAGPHHPGRFRNRLLLETSPYLLQHAQQPVNWFAWSEAAFAEATARNTLVFLSIGYSSCHWCHVMAEESFDSVEIATQMNRQFVSIKVDREERPDLDAIYQGVARTSGIDGGWPLTVIMTPDRKVVYITTYLPPSDNQRGFAIGLSTTLEKISRSYHENPTQIATAMPLVPSKPQSSNIANHQILRQAAAKLTQIADPSWGGFGSRAKFPMTDSLQFLMRMHRRTADPQALAVVSLALQRMAAGGIHDQLAGGFHRYATDARWQIPHFEKMLIDQATLSMLYMQGFALTRNPEFADVARKTMASIQRDFALPTGGYASALDADIQGEEGAYYVWSKAAFDQAVGNADAALAAKAFDVTAAGNMKQGRNVLWRRLTDAELATSFSLSILNVQSTIKSATGKLLAARQQRQKPGIDNKRLTDGNASVLTALAAAATTLQDSQLLQQAQILAKWLLSNAQVNGQVLHVIADGAASQRNGFLDDYALLAAAMIDMYEADANPTWLDAAKSIQHKLHLQFDGSVAGLYFYHPSDHDSLVTRLPADANATGAIGIATAAMNDLRLAVLFDDDTFRKRGEATIAAYSSQTDDPLSSSPLLNAIEMLTDQIKHIVLVAGPNGDAAMSTALFDRFLPNRVVSRVSAANPSTLTGVDGKTAIDGKTTAYVCIDGACAMPTSDITVFDKQLRRVEPLAP